MAFALAPLFGVVGSVVQQASKSKGHQNKTSQKSSFIDSQNPYHTEMNVLDTITDSPIFVNPFEDDKEGDKKVSRQDVGQGLQTAGEVGQIIGTVLTIGGAISGNPELSLAGARSAQIGTGLSLTGSIFGGTTDKISNGDFEGALKDVEKGVKELKGIELSDKKLLENIQNKNNNSFDLLKQSVETGVKTYKIGQKLTNQTDKGFQENKNHLDKVESEITQNTNVVEGLHGSIEDNSRRLERVVNIEENEKGLITNLLNVEEEELEQGTVQNQKLLDEIEELNDAVNPPNTYTEFKDSLGKYEKYDDALMFLRKNEGNFLLLSPVQQRLLIIQLQHKQ